MTSVSKSAVLVLLFLAFAALGHAQETGDSYVRLIVKGPTRYDLLFQQKICRLDGGDECRGNAGRRIKGFRWKDS